MQRLLEEREAAERELKDLASQLGSRTGADAADAGDMHSLKRYWRENERLQKVRRRGVVVRQWWSERCTKGGCTLPDPQDGCKRCRIGALRHLSQTDCCTLALENTWPCF